MKIAIVRNTYNLKSVETYEGETIETKVGMYRDLGNRSEERRGGKEC